MNPIDPRKMTDAEIDRTIARLNRERVSRAIDDVDPAALILQVMDSGFNATGDPIPPTSLGHGIIAINGMVKDTSGSKHRCHLYSIREYVESPEEWWVWSEECPSFIDSDTVKIDSVRRTVSLHAPADGSLIIQHSMIHNGQYHERKAVSGYIVHHTYNNDTGEILESTFEKASKSLMRRLPPPPESDGNR